MKDYGWAWVDGIKKVICASTHIKGGRNKGKIQVTLCRGRDSEGKIKQGEKVIIPYLSLIKDIGEE